MILYQKPVTLGDWITSTSLLESAQNLVFVILPWKAIFTHEYMWSYWIHTSLRFPLRPNSCSSIQPLFVFMTDFSCHLEMSFHPLFPFSHPREVRQVWQLSHGARSALVLLYVDVCVWDCLSPHLSCVREVNQALWNITLSHPPPHTHWRIPAHHNYY